MAGIGNRRKNRFGSVTGIETSDVVVLGARNQIMAQLVSVLSLAGVGHTSGTIRLEDTVGDPHSAWALIEHKYVRNAKTVVLSNGSFWVHAGLVVPLMEWAAKGMHTLVVSVPHEVDPTTSAQVFASVAEQFKCSRRVHILHAPIGEVQQVHKGERVPLILQANGWASLPTMGHA